MQLHLFHAIKKKDITNKMVPISLIIFFMIFGENIVAPIFSIFINSITNDIFLTGIVLSLIGFIGIFVSIPAGVFADKFNLKRTIQIFILPFVVIPILYITFQNFWALIVIRIISAIMSTFLWCAIWTYIYNRVDEHHRAHEISVVSKAMQLSGAISPVLGGLIAIVAFVLPFYVTSLMFLLAFFISSVLLKDHTPTKVDTFMYLLKKDIMILKDIILNYKAAILLSIVSFSVLTSVAVFMPILLEQNGFNFFSIGMVIAISLVPTFIFETQLGDLIDHIGNLKALLFALILIGFTTVVLSISLDLVVVIPIITIFGFANTITFIAFTSLLSEWSNETDRGLLSGTRKSLMNIGAAIGPIVGGLLLSLIGVKTTMAILSAVCLGTAFLFILQKGNLFNKQVDFNK